MISGPSISGLTLGNRSLQREKNLSQSPIAQCIMIQLQIKLSSMVVEGRAKQGIVKLAC
jgi:hypothetical protein